MLRAHPLSFPHHLRGGGISRLVPSWHTLPPHQYSTKNIAIERTKDSAPSQTKEHMSPAAIASAMHQHIAFGTRPWEVGKREKERTALNTRPAKTRVRDETHAPPPGFVKPLRGRSTSEGLPLKRRLRIPTSTAAELEALADDLEAYGTMTMTTSALPRIYYRQSLRPRLLTILAHTQDAACAWAAYRALVVLPRSPDKLAPKVPFPHRHRLLRLLAAVPPAPLRTRGRFAQVLAVLRALHHAGGTIKTWEWNLLLDCAGKEGWRRPREEHYRAALALLAEMRRACGDDGIGETGTTTTATSPATGERGQGWDTDGADAGDSGDAGAGASGGGAGAALALEPDIFSYTTLLAHAVRTRSPAAVRHAAQLLARAGLVPGVYAHTALVCFFARRGDLAGVRDTLFRMRRHAHAGAGAGLPQVPFNAVLWAFAYNGRLDVARAMYRVVRARVAEGGRGRSTPTEAEDEEREEREELEELEELENALAEREMCFISHEVVPDAATYHTLILAHAYHGDLRACLETLTDMLSAPAPLTGTGSVPFPSPSPSLSRRLHREDERDGDGQDGGGFVASLSAFRAIFLGFARHGVVERSSATLSSSSSLPQKNHIHLASIDNPTYLFTGASASPPPFTTQKHHHQQRHHFPSSSFTDHRSSHFHTTDDDPIGSGESSSAWTLATLEALFARFLELPRDTHLRESTLYWLLCAFARTSGRDGEVLRRVFERVEDRFTAASGLICGSCDESGRSGRQGRLARIRGRVFGSS